MDKFLEKCNLPKLIQEELGHMKCHLTINRTDSELKISQRKSQTLDSFTMESSQTFKEQILSILQKLSQSRVKEEIFPT